MKLHHQVKALTPLAANKMNKLIKLNKTTNKTEALAEGHAASTHTHTQGSTRFHGDIINLVG